MGNRTELLNQIRFSLLLLIGDAVANLDHYLAGQIRPRVILSYLLALLINTGR